MGNILDKEKASFSPTQYKLLKKCATFGDMTEWNEWRNNNPDEIIRLEGADFETDFPKGANLFKAKLNYGRMRGIRLRKASLDFCDICDSDLRFAKLQNSNLSFSKLENVDFENANLQNVKSLTSNFEHTNFANTDMQNVSFNNSQITKSYIIESDLRRSSFIGANLCDTKIGESNIGNTIFSGCIVDNTTLIWDCIVNPQTDFRDVALDACRIDPATKALLKCNIRRLNWEEWYKHQKCLIKLPVWLFWELSDYGKSPKRLMGTFFGLSFFFAMTYLFIGRFFPPGLVANLYDHPQYPTLSWLTFFRAWYFSIVTTTTLGFGDMYAQPGSITGHILLSFQVIIGYVILGALITYLGILYNSDGPAGKYADEGDTLRWVKHCARRCRHWFWRKLRRLFRR